ncbi:MAG: hypothetical protein QF411_07465 [Planctomycetota bacterium]|nr:hypothetical protein [Planctomycetota bacterium]
MSWLGRLSLGVLAALFCAAPAGAQLDLPKTKRGADERTHLERRGSGLVVHLICTRCQTHNYRDAVLPEAADGRQKAWCARCRWSTPQRRFDPRSDPSQGLDLPRQPRTGGAGSAGKSPAGGAGGPGGAGGAMDTDGAQAPPGPPTGEPPAISGAAGFVLELLARVRHLEDEVVGEATTSLLSLGPSGLAAARGALASDHGPTILVSVQVLLRGGELADAVAVRGRLGESLPPLLGPLILDELSEQQPVLVDAALLVKLIDHPQARLRAAAQLALVRLRAEGGVAPHDLVKLLAAGLESERADTRRRLVDLLSGSPDPAALEALLGRLGEKSASVSAAAVKALAVAPQADTAARLFRLAFDSRWLRRREAYALLALVEREDRLLEPILGAGQVEELLGAAASRDPFVSAAAALTLAGIGFRSQAPCSWLDQKVPDILVHALSGTVFHNDYSALQAPAARRLAQLSGQRHGTAGPAWVSWWLTAREDFRARRAALRVAPEEEALLDISYRDTGSDPCMFTFWGPARAQGTSPQGAPAPLGGLLRLTAPQCQSLVALVRREGLLGAERLPGLRGQTRPGMRVLELSFPTDAADADAITAKRAADKTFTFGPDTGAPWFEAVVAALRDLEKRNRWQAFPPPELATDLGAFWELEAPWWEEPHTPEERAGRLKDLIISSLPGQARPRRGRGGELLAELYQQPSLVSAADFKAFLFLLRDEPFLDGRARLWLALARRAAGLEGGVPFSSRFAAAAEAAGARDEPSTPEVAATPQSIALAGDLVDILELKYGGEAAAEIAELLAFCGPECARAAAGDGRPILRAVAASLLARTGAVEDGEILLRLLDDEVPGVEVAAIQAIGEQSLELGRTEVFLRARLSRGPVRRAALEAVGRLGGAAAVEVLIDGVHAAEVGASEAAARGLVHLGDPATAPILISMLGGTQGDEFLDPVRAALAGLGAAAHGELLAAMGEGRSGERPSRTCREAALLLARQGVAAAAEPLLRVLEDEPMDSRAAAELAILTAVDFREEEEPAQAWRAWWGTVVHGDSYAWLRAGAERVGISAPPAGALEDGVHPERRAAFFFLTDLLEGGPQHLAERGRRLLEQWTGRAISVPRALTVERASWFEKLREEAP